MRRAFASLGLTRDAKRGFARAQPIRNPTRPEEIAFHAARKTPHWRGANRTGMTPRLPSAKTVTRAAQRGNGSPRLGAALLLAVTLLAYADETSPEATARFAARAAERFAEAQARFAASPTNLTAAWELARAAFDRAEFATNNAERAALAEQGIAAARQALARDSNCAPAHYYLGMNLGQLARTRTLGALRLVSEMERAFQAARRLDARFDFAGPDRNLGLLYLQAPVIGSIGDRKKAREHLERAVALAPEYPENHLNLAEARWKWGDRTGALRAFTTLDEIWPEARLRFDGPDWEAGWADWTARRKRLAEQLHQALGPGGASPAR
jgi:tetratricopeptide (TPR) repeat protein